MSALYSRGSRKKGMKSEVATSSLSSPGPTSGRNGFVTVAFLAVPSRGEKNQLWLLWGQGQTCGYAAPNDITKKFPAKGVPALNNRSKKAPKTIVKKGGDSETPHRIRFLSPPPPLQQGPLRAKK